MTGILCIIFPIVVATHTGTQIHFAPTIASPLLSASPQHMDSQRGSWISPMKDFGQFLVGQQTLLKSGRLHLPRWQITLTPHPGTSGFSLLNQEARLRGVLPRNPTPNCRDPDAQSSSG
jgi:hypothetical protein